jgi:hypothetical protein
MYVSAVDTRNVDVQTDLSIRSHDSIAHDASLWHLFDCPLLLDSNRVKHHTNALLARHSLRAELPRFSLSIWPGYQPRTRSSEEVRRTSMLVVEGVPPQMSTSGVQLLAIVSGRRTEEMSGFKEALNRPESSAGSPELAEAG